MNRTIFYVVSATSEENQAGAFHYSKPFKTKASALAYSKKILTPDIMASIEEHREKPDGYGGWEIDHDAGGVVSSEYCQ